MSATYEKAPEVHDLLMRIIKKWHPDIINARFYCLLKDPPGSSKGKVVVAQVKKFPSYLVPDAGEHDYLLTYAKIYWESHSPAQKEYILDHEASHCKVDTVLEMDEYTGEILRAEYGLVGHDWEDFAAVVERHGLISQELENMAAACQQMSLPFPGKASDNTKRMKDWQATDFGRPKRPFWSEDDGDDAAALRDAVRNGPGMALVS